VANPKTQTAPAVEPVTTDEAKKQARIPHTADDTYVASLIVAAREACENFLNRRLITQTLEYFRDDFPWDSPEIELPGGRLQSITSLKYTDSDNTENTVDTGVYFAVTTAEPGSLRLAYGEVWPSAILKPAEAVVVRYVVGYGLAAAVPADIRHGILLMVAHLYNDRGDEDKFTAGAPPTDMPVAAKRLLWPHRIESRF
jgi:uncharacterized phiE125 gp8 family phage protein